MSGRSGKPEEFHVSRDNLAPMRVAILACALLGVLGFGQAVDLAGHPADPFTSPAKVRVFLFVRSDCPVTNRYAPEVARIARKFPDGVAFWLVYPDRSETSATIEAHIAAYHFPGTALRDPSHQIVKLAQATVAPEAAVFDRANQLVYLGRIDDRYVDLGKQRASAQVHDLENAIAAALEGKKIAQSKTRAIGCSLADVQ